MSERTNDLYSMVRDLIILSECDYVICGFSSNVSILEYKFDLTMLS